MLTYADVHLIYTLPVVGALALIVWPFVGRQELFRIAFVSAAAFVYTTPWDNYIISHGAWTYRPEKVVAAVGYVPVEEYAFFVVQTVMTTLWSLACTRWSPACLHFNYDMTSYRLIRWTPIAALALTAVLGYRIAVPGRHTFYLGCIMWWSCPVVAFLWYGAGNYFARRLTSAAVAVLVPTLYLCRVDQIALRDDVWHINEATSLNVFPAADLPLEEALFFLVTNVIVVLGGMAFDKSGGIADAYPSAFPLRYSIASPSYHRQQMRAFTTAECDLSPGPVDDIRRCLDVLEKASKSFNVASLVFPPGVRLHLMILYAFCRATDNMIDDEPDAGRKKQKLSLIERFVGELFADRRSDYEVLAEPDSAVVVDLKSYRTRLTDVELSCFRAVSTIAFYLPRKPFLELLDGYRWDVDGRPVRTEADLLLYSSYVAGSVGTLCVYVMVYKCGDRYALGDHDFVIGKAQQMGQVLQIVNISRDIVTDSETLGRCYVPAEYMDDWVSEVNVLCADRAPWTLGATKLKEYAARMIKLADRHRLESLEGIQCLPYEVRGPVLVATDIYRGVAAAVQASPTYPRRASLGKWDKILVGTNSLYFRSLRYLMRDQCKKSQ